MRERRTLARIAPHAVGPLPFALPLYRSLTRGKLAMRAGFLVDRIVAVDRNRGVAPVACTAGRARRFRGTRPSSASRASAAGG